MATTSTYSWQSATSGGWSTAANWTRSGTHAVPGATNTAAIGATGSNYTVTYDTTGSVINLGVTSANATLAFAPSETLTATGVTSLTAGTIDVLAAGAVLKTANLSTAAGTAIDVGSGGVLTITASNAGILNGLLESTAGAGVVNGSLTGSGTIEASGGLLDITGSVANTLHIEADSAASSVLELTGAVGAGTGFAFLNTGGVYAGELLLGSAAQASFETNATISGMHVHAGGAAPSDFIDLSGVSPGAFASSAIVNGNTIELLNSGSAVAAHFTLATAPGAGAHVDWASDANGGTDIFLSDAPCYVAGTRILTDRGEMPVEALGAGDLVVTLAGEARALRPVKWIGRRRIDLTAHPRPDTAAPIRIRRGAFSDTMPARDLLVSPDHAIFVDGVLIAARQLVNGASIHQELGWPAVAYVHVELDSHAVLLAEGLPAESYLDTGNRGFFANSDGPLTLHPDLTQPGLNRAEGACAPFVVDEAAVRPIWQRLVERAADLGHAVPGLAITTEADLRLLAGGRQIRPIIRPTPGRDGVCIFPLPLGATSARLLSRAASPARARPWLDDRRELGVSVARIVVRGAEDVVEIPLDHPDFADGWWAAETSGAIAHRWTDGDALIPLPTMRGHALLEVHLRGGMPYVIEAERDAA